MTNLIPGRLSFNNPVIAASGTFGYGTEYAAKNDESVLGGIVCKGITVEPRAGHPPLRIVETAAGVLNAIGLANIGVDAMVAKKAPLWAEMTTPVIANINGESIEEYVAVATRLRGVPGVAAIELNVSCPNVADGGMAFGRDAGMAAEVTAAVRAANDAPLIVKLTPNTEDIVAVARAVVSAGAEALTVANTYLGLALDTKRRKPALSNVTGGLSGPAIKPLTLRLVRDIAVELSIPIMGCGGVVHGNDAIEYFMAGASAVQVGTATLADPFAVSRIGREVKAWLENNKINDICEIVGAANHRPDFEVVRT